MAADSASGLKLPSAFATASGGFKLHSNSKQSILQCIKLSAAAIVIELSHVSGTKWICTVFQSTH